MLNPLVVNVRHYHPWTEIHREYHYIGRFMPRRFKSSPFANPFSHASRSQDVISVSTAGVAVAAYRYYVLGEWDYLRDLLPSLQGPEGVPVIADLMFFREAIVEGLPALREWLQAGKPVGCWCLDEEGRGSCHGISLVEIALGEEYHEIIRAVKGAAS
jgi:hypothetical protein